LIREVWQRECERTFIQEPEIYQYHCFVLKLNNKGQAQDRALVLSDSWIYNLQMEHNPTAIKDKKWAFPILALKAVAVHSPKTCGVATLYFDQALYVKKMDAAHTGSKKGEKFNDRFLFQFRDETQCQRLVQELRRLSYYLTKNHLHVEQKDQITDVKQMSPKTEDRILLQDNFLKFTKAGGGSHDKSVRYYSTAVIEWLDDKPNSKPSREQVVSVNPDLEALKKKKLSKDEQDRLLALQTTGKTLYLLAKTADVKKMWIEKIGSHIRDCNAKHNVYHGCTVLVPKY